MYYKRSVSVNTCLPLIVSILRSPLVVVLVVVLVVYEIALVWFESQLLSWLFVVFVYGWQSSLHDLPVSLILPCSVQSFVDNREL